MSKVLVFGKKDYLPGYQPRKNNSSITQIIDFNVEYDPDNEPNYNLKDAKFDVNILINQRLNRKGAKNNSGQDTGRSTKKGRQDKKTLISRKFVFKSVNCGPTFTLLEEKNGDLFIFGENNNGCLGNLAYRNADILPTCAKFGKIKPGRLKSFACSGDHTVLVTSEDALYGWGKNKWSCMNSGSLGNYNKMTELNLKFTKSRNPEYYEKNRKDAELHSIFSLIKLPQENAKKRFLEDQKKRKISNSITEANEANVCKEEQENSFNNTTLIHKSPTYRNQKTIKNTLTETGESRNFKLKKAPSVIREDMYSSTKKDFAVGFDQSTVENCDTAKGIGLPPIKTNRNGIKTHRGMNSEMQPKLGASTSTLNRKSTTKLGNQNSKTNVSEKADNLMDQLNLNLKPQHQNTKSATARDMKRYFSDVTEVEPITERNEIKNIVSFHTGPTPEPQNKSGNARALMSKLTNSFADVDLASKNKHELSPRKLHANKDEINGVACNSTCTYYISKKNVFSIGQKDSNQLGFENTALLLNQPIPIDLEFKIQVRGLSANRKHVLLWDSDGFLYSWGSNQYCQLGVENNLLHRKKWFKKPQKVFICMKKKVMFGLAGVDSSFIITNRGKVYYWGMPIKRVDGRGAISEQLTKLDFPKKKNADKEISIVKMTSTDYDYGAMDTTGRLYTWGNNMNENLGFSCVDEDFKHESPNALKQLDDYVVYDFSMNPSNLVCVAFPRNKTTEKLLQLTPIIRNFYDNIRMFLAVEQTDLNDIKQEELYQQAIKEENPMAGILSMSQRKINIGSASINSSAIDKQKDNLLDNMMHNT